MELMRSVVSKPSVPGMRMSMRSTSTGTSARRSEPAFREEASRTVVMSSCESNDHGKSASDKVLVVNEADPNRILRHGLSFRREWVWLR